ncbi:hypothetical protein PR048_027197 [Dryococelus australis]|uniref:Uncharacterized protein n=1 Tax=Dryococelus australis TaxID=614101 RepID=A0ABQ9GG68_9NEOP|nr:hypothetical protein PR048_027197 [Dryococelus australis]
MIKKELIRSHTLASPPRGRTSPHLRACVRWSMEISATRTCFIAISSPAAWFVLHAICFLVDSSTPVTVQDFVQLLRQDRWNMARRGTLRNLPGGQALSDLVPRSGRADSSPWVVSPMAKAAILPCCYTPLLNAELADGSYGSGIDFFGSDTSSAIDFLRHGADSTIDFFGWVTYSNAAIDPCSSSSICMPLRLQTLHELVRNIASCNIAIREAHLDLCVRMQHQLAKRTGASLTSRPRSAGDKDDFAMLIKCVIAPTRKTVNWRAVHSSRDVDRNLLKRAVSPLASHIGEPGSIHGRSPNFRKWESCLTTPLVGRFSRVSPVSPALSFRRCSILISNTHIGSQDLAVKSRPNLFTLQLNFTVLCILEPASFLHWLPPRCEVTPFLTELHVIGAHNCEVFIYWRRVTWGVSNEERPKQKRIAKVCARSTPPEIGSLSRHLPAQTNVIARPPYPSGRVVMKGLFPRDCVHVQAAYVSGEIPREICVCGNHIGASRRFRVEPQIMTGRYKTAEATLIPIFVSAAWYVYQPRPNKHLAIDGVEANYRCSLPTRASAAGMKGRGKREIPEKTCRPAASSGTIPTCENPGGTRSGIVPSSPRWEASRLTAASV